MSQDQLVEEIGRIAGGLKEVAQQNLVAIENIEIAVNKYLECIVKMTEKMAADYEKETECKHDKLIPRQDGPDDFVPVCANCGESAN